MAVALVTIRSRWMRLKGGVFQHLAMQIIQTNFSGMAVVVPEDSPDNLSGQPEKSQVTALRQRGVALATRTTHSASITVASRVMAIL